MEKIILILFFYLTLFAKVDLEKTCLECHKKQQIPSGLIYKRYLLKYSTKDKIKHTMFSYLKNPKKKNSIMPKPFFLRFPMKKPINITNKDLHDAIRLYIDKFDIRKRLVLGK